MATTTEITAAEWLSVRDRLADEIRAAHTRMERSTAVKIAEALLRKELVDVVALRPGRDVEIVAEAIGDWDVETRLACDEHPEGDDACDACGEAQKRFNRLQYGA